jgi:hypothetical protein
MVFSILYRTKAVARMGEITVTGPSGLLFRDFLVLLKSTNLLFQTSNQVSHLLVYYTNSNERSKFHMGRFLDLRESENSSYQGYPAVNVPVTEATAATVAEIGLQTAGVSGKGGLGGLIVDLKGVLGLAASIVPGTVVLRVARATTTAGPFTTIYTARQFLLSTLSLPQLVPIHAVDVTAPPAAELVYRLLVHSEGILTLAFSPVRTGPEAFSGIAMDGDSPPA